MFGKPAIATLRTGVGSDPILRGKAGLPSAAPLPISWYHGNMTKQAECPFCDLGAQVVKENNLAVAVLSNPRKVPGHLLVLPKRHVEKPWDLTDEELTSIFTLIFFIEKRLIGKLGDGCDIKQNYRPFLPQSRLKADHVVFHVYPRSLYDYLYKVAEVYETDLFADLDELERAEVAKFLKE